MRITILNLNAWLLPWPFSKDNKARLRKIVEFIKEHNPDIITLQEIWMKKYIKYLKKNLENLFLVSRGGEFFNKGGMVILSKFKLFDKKVFTFRENKNFNVIERIADKGCLQASFDYENKKIDLINFQLYNTTNKKEEDLVIKQYEKLKKITEKIKNFSNDMLILAGDLNMPREKFKEINRDYFLYSQNKTFTFSKENPYTQSRLNPWFCKKYFKNDFVLVYPNNKKCSLTSNVIKSPLLSDHFAILAEVNFK